MGKKLKKTAVYSIYLQNSIFTKRKKGFLSNLSPSMTRFFLFLSFNVCTLLCLAQETNYSFLNFNYKDGFPEKYVYSVTQDQKGTMWFGTGTGLYCFNGNKFKKVNSSEDNTQHQIGNLLLNVYTDIDGSLWLTSLNAIQRYNPNLKRFTSVNYKEKAVKEIIKSNPSQIIRDPKGNLWIATRKNYWYRFENKTSKVKIHFVPKGIKINESSRIINKIICLPNNVNFALSNNGLFSYNSKNMIDSYFYSNKESAFYDGYYDQKNNCLWLACGYDGVVKFDLKTKAFTKYECFNSRKNFFSIISPKNANEIWFGSTVLGIFNTRNSTLKFFQPETSSEFRYQKYPLSNFYRDKESNLWLASFNGISVLPWQNSQIKKLELRNEWANYIVEPYGVFTDNETYYFLNNTSNGLLTWNQKKKNWKLIEIPELKGNYKSINGIVSIAKNKFGNCIAASKKELFILNLKEQQMYPLSVFSDAQRITGTIRRILFDQENKLYVQTYENGFYILDFNSKKQRHFSPEIIRKKTSNKESGNITLQLIDAQNRIWFTHTKGVYLFNFQNNSFQLLASRSAKNNQTRIQESIDIMQEDQNNFWISTHENGIFKLTINAKSEHLINFNQSNSLLPSDYCENLVLDKQKNLWIGTLNGLVKFDTKKNKVRSIFSQQNGLTDNNAIIPISLNSIGELILCFYGEASILNTQTYKSNNQPPHISVTEIKSTDRALNPFNLKSIKFNSDETHLSFRFQASTNTNCNQFLYRYKLTGNDNSWKYTTSNFLAYNNLNYGAHTLKIQGRNNDGYWGPINQLSFYIKPPFWKRPIVYVSFTFLLLAIGYYLYRRKLNSIRNEERLKSHFETEIAQLELKAMRAQMNPHFLFNSLNSIQKYLLQNDGLTASKYLSKFSKLIRLILENSNQQQILLGKEIELMKLYMEIESMRFQEKFEYSIKVDPSIPTDTITIPSMLIQPYLENAIWHGLLHKETKGYLHFEITLLDQSSLQVIIEDNGIGRRKANELKSKQILTNKSFGMKITEDRIALINKYYQSKTSIKIEDLTSTEGEAMGTRVQLTIPFNHIKKDENHNN